MNIEKLTILRDTLESLQHEPNKDYPDIGFNMEYWISLDYDEEDKSPHRCGTIACIGGWTHTIFDSLDLIEDILGLSKYQADVLLFGLDSGVRLCNITLEDAVKTLTILIETGKADWSHVQCK